MWHDIYIATVQTLYMIFVSSFFSILFGIILGCILFFYSNPQLARNKYIYTPLNAIVNIGRSIPFIILMISLIPFTRWLVGTTIGTNAAIVPLTIAAIPFVGRMVENAFNELSLSLFETAKALGSSSWQIIRYYLLPEAQIALIRIATLTIITLIGYSAMAGAVGGGGLGELAISYGYQRFEPIVMLITVAILVALVQLIQYLGELCAKFKPYKTIAILCLLAWVISIVSFCYLSFHTQQTTLSIGVISGKQEEVMKVAQQVAKEQYNLNIKIIPFDDYVLPNTALNDGNIDANIFQHKPYLDAQLATRHYHLAILGKTFVYPMGFFSSKITNIAQLPVGATIAIPNDPSNEGRALLLLQQAKLIKLDPSAGLFATPENIISNPKQLKFYELDAAQLPRTLPDSDLVALTNDYIGPAGFTVNQALLKESGVNNPYVNLIVVQAKEVNNPSLQKLIAIMHSKEVIAAMNKAYPDGAAIPGW